MDDVRVCFDALRFTCGLIYRFDCTDRDSDLGVLGTLAAVGLGQSHGPGRWPIKAIGNALMIVTLFISATGMFFV